MYNYMNYKLGTPRYTTNVASGYQYEDLNQPFANLKTSQQDRTRKLLAEQLRLMEAQSASKPKSSGGFRSLNLEDLFNMYGILS